MGTGFTSQSPILFYIDTTANGTQIPYVTSDKNGKISVKVQLPNSAIVQGQHTFIAQDYTSSNEATTTLTFLPYIPSVAGQSYQTIQFSGTSFAANETVNAYWGTNTSGPLEATSTTDATGNLSFSFIAPDHLVTGSYPITIQRTHEMPTTIRTYFKVFPITLISEPGGIHAGKSVTIKVTGFMSFEGLNVQWNANGGQIIGYLFTDKNGSAKSSIVPPSAPLGTYTVTAIDSHGLQATGTLSIGPGISINSNDIIPSAQIGISGGGFSSGETVNIYLQMPKNGVVSVTTDASGAFNILLPLPSTYSSATSYFVHAVNTTGTEHAKAPLKFLTPLAEFGNEYNQSSDIYYGYGFLLNASNFGSGETVDIIWNYHHPDQYTIASAKANANGDFFVNISAPSMASSTITIATIGETSHLIVVQTVNNFSAIQASGGTDTGQSVTVTGGNFGANDTITVLFDNKIVTTATSASDGTFSATFLLPVYPGTNSNEIEAKDVSANRSAAPIFYYYAPIVTATPSVVENGDEITVTGTRFTPQSELWVTWGYNGQGWNNRTLFVY